MTSNTNPFSQDQEDDLDARFRRHSRGVMIGYVILAAGIGFAINVGSENNAATHKLATESATTRVHTVSQRCALTGLLAEEIPAARVKLLASKKKCDEQLVEVKAIAKSGVKKNG